MKITALITNRQSGKTQKANYEFIKDPENTLFVCTNQNQCKDQPYYELYKNNHISIETFLYSIKGKTYKNIIFDEYLFYHEKNMIAIYDYLKVHLTVYDINVYIFSTPVEPFNEHKFEYVSEMKEDGIYSSSQMYENFINRFGTDIEDNFNKYYYNLLTEPECLIINDNYFNNQHILEDKVGIIKSPLEITGKLF